LDFLAFENEDTAILRYDGNYLKIDTALTAPKTVHPQFLRPLLDLEVVNDVSKMEIKFRRNDSRFPILDCVYGTEI
jgi:hypothetical protein